jgi:hypothetical protein
MTDLVMSARHAALRWRLLRHMGWRAGWRDGRRAWHHVEEAETEGGLGCLGTLSVCAYCVAGFLIWTKDGLFGLDWRGLRDLVSAHFCGAFAIWLAGLFALVYLVAAVVWLAAALGHLPGNLAALFRAQQDRRRMAGFVYLMLLENFGGWLDNAEIEALYRDLMPALDAAALDSLARGDALQRWRSLGIERCRAPTLRRLLLESWPALMVARLTPAASAAIIACVAGDDSLRQTLLARALAGAWCACWEDASALARLLDRLPPADAATLLDAFVAEPDGGSNVARLMIEAQREGVDLRRYAAWLETAPIAAVEALVAGALAPGKIT